MSIKLDIYFVDNANNNRNNSHIFFLNYGRNEMKGASIIKFAVVYFVFIIIICSSTILLC